MAGVWTGFCDTQLWVNRDQSAAFPTAVIILDAVLEFDGIFGFDAGQERCVFKRPSRSDFLKRNPTKRGNCVCGCTTGICLHSLASSSCLLVAMFLMHSYQLTQESHLHRNQNEVISCGCGVFPCVNRLQVCQVCRWQKSLSGWKKSKSANCCDRRYQLGFPWVSEER